MKHAYEDALKQNKIVISPNEHYTYHYKSKTFLKKQKIENYTTKHGVCWCQKTRKNQKEKPTPLDMVYTGVIKLVKNFEMKKYTT